jgi:uncharacterized protein YeaO (DUF488 family)
MVSDRYSPSYDQVDALAYSLWRIQMRPSSELRFTVMPYSHNFTIEKYKMQIVKNAADIKCGLLYQLNINGSWRDVAVHSIDHYGGRVYYGPSCRIRLRVVPPPSPSDSGWVPHDVEINEGDLGAGRLRLRTLTADAIAILQAGGKDKVSREDFGALCAMASESIARPSTDQAEDMRKQIKELASTVASQKVQLLTYGEHLTQIKKAVLR